MSSKKVPRHSKPPSRGPFGGRPPKQPKAPKPPKGLHGTCMVGELLVPLFGRRWVDEVTAHGGLLPYLLRPVAAAWLMHDVPGGSTGDVCPKKLLVAALLTAKALFVHWRELPALWRETGELNR